MVTLSENDERPSTPQEPTQGRFQTRAMAPEVRVELYVCGKGPRHEFKETLKGWDQNRLDLESIMHTYKLQALYAFSSSGGRGNRLLFNPRDGLSTIAYSGKSGVTIRLDGDPAESLLLLLAKVLLGFVLIGSLAFLALSESLPEPIAHFRDSGRSYITVLACFVTMLYTQLIWRPMKRKRLLAYGHNMEDKLQQALGPLKDDRTIEAKKDS